MWLCSLTKHDGLHPFWERLHSWIPIDYMLVCEEKQCANMASDHNTVLQQYKLQYESKEAY